jgi:hypothetical protein
MSWEKERELSRKYLNANVRLQEERDLLADYIRDLLVEIQQFKDADAKRHKTIDGVTVEPGMRVYLDWAGRTFKVESVGVDGFSILYTKSEEGWGVRECTMLCSDAFSSREACERWKASH